VQAARVVKAAHIDREIREDEDVHHTCETRRYVDADHLVVIATADHQAHHAAKRRQERCSVHNIPYARRNAKGWGVCLKCAAEGSARYYRRHPPKPMTDKRRDQLRAACRAYRARKRAARLTA
jgi:hypothetical protein